MATRKRTVVDDEPLARLPAAPVGVSTPMTPPPSLTDERRERELEDLLQELGSDGRIKVWHVIDGKSAYAGEMSLDGFSLDALTDAYGGGDKTLVFYQGRTKIDTLRVALDPSIPVRNPKTPRPNAAPASGGSSLGDMSSLIAAMAQSSMSSMQMMQTMMMQSSQMTTTMLQAVATALTATKGNDKDPMEHALKIAELMKVNTATPASELFSVFEKGMNVAAKINGGDEDGTLSLAREGLQVVAKVLENNRPQATAHGPRQAALGAGHGTANAGRPNNNGGPGVVAAGAQSEPQASDAGAGTATDAGATGGVVADVRPWVAAARPAAALLLLSIGNVRPETAADMIADRLTEDQFGDLVDDIESGTPGEFVQRFMQYFQATLDDNTYRWMLDCVQCLKALIEPDDLPPSAESATHEP